MPISSFENPYSKAFLEQHCKDIYRFYDSRVVDQEGGYFQNYLDNGEVFNPQFKHLVSSARIIVNYARGYSLLSEKQYAEFAIHGLTFLEKVHWREDKQGYAWTLQGNEPLDMTQQNYGYAFVLLAYAAIHKAKIKDTKEDIKRVFDLMEARFWQPDFELYADEISAGGVLSPYRGQNANMHACEAMISAFEATGDTVYFSKAKCIAENITARQADQTRGLVWEHYTPTFQTDWDYNRDDPKNLYRPWGFQPGHQTEWAKLLVSLYRIEPNTTWLTRAQFLFDSAYKVAWDNEYGGLIYGFDDEGNWCDDDKYFWVQAESFAAAALLYQETKEAQYLDAYKKLWAYSWEHFVDHQYGAWFRLLSRNNAKVSDEKSSAGAKCDYHTLGACFDVLMKL